MARIGSADLLIVPKFDGLSSSVNKALGKEQFNSEYVQMADRYMKSHQNATVDQLLKNNNYADFH